MARVRIEDLKPEAMNLSEKEMKKLFGGAIIIDENTLKSSISVINVDKSKIAIPDVNVANFLKF
jgi:hypothetical protein